LTNITCECDIGFNYINKKDNCRRKSNNCTDNLYKLKLCKQCKNGKCVACKDYATLNNNKSCECNQGFIYSETEDKCNVQENLKCNVNDLQNNKLCIKCNNTKCIECQKHSKLNNQTICHCKKRIYL